MYDYLIVGAGFSGATLAERLVTSAGQSVLVIDKRSHIGGNAFDFYDDHGVLVHKYGPHIFHTNSDLVWQYLSRFTKWRPYEHRVLASVQGQLLPIPVNLDTVNRLHNLNLTSAEVAEWFREEAEPRDRILTAEDAVVSKIGRDLFDLFFRNYTKKQWGVDASSLSPQVTARIPFRTNRDDRYFTDRYQAMPLHGYTKMFESMLSRPRLHLMLNTSYRDIAMTIPHRNLIWTGPIDEYFHHRLGHLPYRSLRFHYETVDADLLLPTGTVNYPNTQEYTRVTEMKHLTGQRHHKTTLIYEYPMESGDPFYPIPNDSNAAMYEGYAKLAEPLPNVHFAGRLGTYQYYNMDQVVAQALTLFRRLHPECP